MTPRVAVWLIWLGLFVLATIGVELIRERPEIRVAHGVLIYLVLIVGASRQGGRPLSLVMITLAYLAVQYSFIPPRGSFSVADKLDAIILGGFAITGLLISELFAAQQRAVALAEARAREVERLSLERLQLEQEASTARVLREADRLKNALLDSVAHDLRSPVATLSLLADPAAGFEPQLALSRVNQEAQRLSAFLLTLQEFARSGGSNTLATDTHDAVAVVQTAVRSAQAMLEGRTLTIHPPDSPVLVSCDLTLTVHVLGNLLQNASRYSPAGAPVDISVESHHRGAFIVVADRGPGLAGDAVESLFSPLRREVTDAIEPSGEARMGMGLSIARTFARAQRGDVTYRARKGGGSEFVLRLPYAPT